MPSDDPKPTLGLIEGGGKKRTNPYDLKHEDVKILAHDGEMKRKYVASLTIELGGKTGKVTCDYWEPLPVHSLKDIFIRREISKRAIAEARRQLMNVEEKLRD